MSFTLTYHDGSEETISQTEVEMLEEEINFVSYKRKMEIFKEEIAIEMSSNIGEPGLKKTMAFISKKVNYECNRAIDKIGKEQ